MKKIVLLIVIILISACSSKKAAINKPNERPAEQTVEILGPELPIGPMPSEDFKEKKDGIVVVFGPGLAKAMSAIGVLKKLNEKSININAIISLEMSALISSAWVSLGTNQLEWLMHKFNKETYLDFPLISFKKKTAKRNNLKDFILKANLINSLEKSKTPIYITSLEKSNDEKILFENTGNTLDRLLASLTYPSLFEDYKINNQPRITSALVQPIAGDFAKQLNLGKVVCVVFFEKVENNNVEKESYLETLMKSIAVIQRQQLSSCDSVININNSTIDFLDFSLKAEAIYNGIEATENWLNKQ